MKFKKLDRLFADDAVGDGNTGVTEPFEAAQVCFYRGQVHRMVRRDRGRLCLDHQKLAQEAAAGDDVIAILLLVSIYQKG